MSGGFPSQRGSNVYCYFDVFIVIATVQCKNAIFPLSVHFGYHSLTQTHQFILYFISLQTEPNGEESEENVAEKVIKTEPSEKAGIMEIHQYLSDTYLPNAGGKNGQDSDDGASSTEAETSEIMQQTKNTSKELNNPNELEIDSNDDNMDSALPQKRYIIRSLGKRKRRMSAPDESDFTRYPSLSMPPLGASSTSQDHAYKLAQEEYAGKLRIAAQDQTVDNEETKLKIITQKRLLQMAQREHEQKMKNLKLKEQILRLQRDKLLADKSTNLRFDDI